MTVGYFHLLRSNPAAFYYAAILEEPRRGDEYVT